MQTFVWSEEFITGIDSVDDQHHGLVSLFNDLGDALTEPVGEDEAALKAVFTQLLDYARHHFSIEEALMRRAGIDPRHFALHLKLHDDFAEQVRALWSARTAFHNPAEVFLSFLTSWIGLHILGVDQSMARQLVAIRSGHSAEQAFAQEAQRGGDHGAEVMIKALRNAYGVVSRLSQELLAANRFLEARVEARTDELKLANAALAEMNRKLEIFSQTDGLLGVANRHCFDVRLQEEWQRAMREALPLGLLMLDVDFFKNYNDRYGHLAGDDCLKAVARAAACQTVRATDLFARYGGEEFVVLLPHTELPGACKLGEDICQAVRALHLAHAASTVADCVTVSIGAVARVPERNSSPQQILAAADQALYLAKQSGRNRVCSG